MRKIIFNIPMLVIGTSTRDGGKAVEGELESTEATAPHIVFHQ